MTIKKAFPPPGINDGRGYKIVRSSTKDMLGYGWSADDKARIAVEHSLPASDVEFDLEDYRKVAAARIAHYRRNAEPEISVAHRPGGEDGAEFLFNIDGSLIGRLAAIRAGAGGGGLSVGMSLPGTPTEVGIPMQLVGLTVEDVGTLCAAFEAHITENIEGPYVTAVAALAAASTVSAINGVVDGFNTSFSP